MQCSTSKRRRDSKRSLPSFTVLLLKFRIFLQTRAKKTVVLSSLHIAKLTSKGISLSVHPCSPAPLATGIRYIQSHSREVQEFQHQIRRLESMYTEINRFFIKYFCLSGQKMLAPSLLLLRKEGILSVKGP